MDLETVPEVEMVQVVEKRQQHRLFNLFQNQVHLHRFNEQNQLREFQRQLQHQLQGFQHQRQLQRQHQGFQHLLQRQKFQHRHQHPKQLLLRQEEGDNSSE